jgi:hypothetical protein
VTSRRQFLRGLGGVLFPLPFLSSARGAVPPPEPHPLVVVRVANGVSQRLSWEPPLSERFWPPFVGPLDPLRLGMGAVSELVAHTSRLLLVRGTDAVFPAQAEAHVQAGNQLLTARPPGDPVGGQVMTWARGESLDNYVARGFPDVNRGEPLTLYTGRRSGFGEEVLSYRGPDDLRAAEDDPWAVYRRLTGGGLSEDRRTSLDALVTEQLQRLLTGPQLSTEDRQRLESHADSVWDFEVLCQRLSAEQEDAVAGLSGLSRLDEHRLAVARLHCDVLALALECDLVRAATLQIGDRTDITRYTVDGERFESYHAISHRTMPGDGLRHHQIDRLHLQLFAYLLDRLEERGLLERSVVCFVSELGNGFLHETVNLPWVIAGRGDGTLRNGEFVDAGGVSHHHLLATLLTATGLRRPDGAVIDHFGDESLPPGLLDVALAR